MASINADTQVFLEGLEGYLARARATSAALRQPALVATRPEPVPVSAHPGNGQAQGAVS